MSPNLFLEVHFSDTHLNGLISAVGKLQHMAAKAMGRTTLAYANEHRSYETAQKLYFRLLQTYKNWNRVAEQEF